MIKCCLFTLNSQAWDKTSPLLECWQERTQYSSALSAQDNHCWGGMCFNRTHVTLRAQVREELQLHQAAGQGE